MRNSKGQFLPGVTPFNKGTKGLMKPNSGSFQKGSIPANLYEIGQERISKDGYIEVKVNQRNPYTGAPTWFRFKHRLIWEAEHGPIPAGHAVVFLDGDRLNCDLDNLRCVPRSVLAHLNQRYLKLGDSEGEARKAGILIAEVIAKAHKRAKA